MHMNGKTISLSLSLSLSLLVGLKHSDVPLGPEVSNAGLSLVEKEVGVILKKQKPMLECKVLGA